MRIARFVLGLVALSRPLSLDLGLLHQLRVLVSMYYLEHCALSGSLLREECVKAFKGLGFADKTT